jgi:hypothetical protein
MEAKKIKVKRHLDNNQAKALKGKFLDASHYDQVITGDCDGYDLAGNLLFRFRKGAIPHEVVKSGVDAFRGSIQFTDGRGITSGSSHKRIRKDGSVSNITVGNKVYSGNVGYMDAGAMVKYCRQTAFARDHFETFASGVPFVQYIDKLYGELCPLHHKKQMDIARGTDQNYVIEGTSFTTVTVNKNFRTACHQDAGDFRDGFGNLIVYREGSYTGSFFVMPEYRIAIDLHTTDVLFCDVHKWHGNTAMENKSDDALRISFVMYYRENMIKCDSPSKQLADIKVQKNGYYTL